MVNLFTLFREDSGPEKRNSDHDSVSLRIWLFFYKSAKFEMLQSLAIIRTQGIKNSEFPRITRKNQALAPILNELACHRR